MQALNYAGVLCEANTSIEFINLSVNTNAIATYVLRHHYYIATLWLRVTARGAREFPILNPKRGNTDLPAEASNPGEVLHVVRDNGVVNTDDLLPGEESHREELLVLVNVYFNSASLHDIHPVGVVEHRRRVVRLEFAEAGVEHASNCKLSFCSV